MYQIITDGNWPVMLTPFTEQNNVDYEALERLIDWYIERGQTDSLPYVNPAKCIN